MMPRSETDADIEFAMLTTHEDPPLPPRVEKGRACSNISEIKIGLVILLLAYLTACGAAYALGYHGAGFLLKSWFFAAPVSNNSACEGLHGLVSHIYPYTLQITLITLLPIGWSLVHHRRRPLSRTKSSRTWAFDGSGGGRYTSSLC
jgi:hypothetical protein